VNGIKKVKLHLGIMFIDHKKRNKQNENPQTPSKIKTQAK
jgi:hypothetical protein